MSSPGFFSALKAIFLGPSISQAQREAAKATVEDLISSSPVAVFSKSYCPYCNRAKALLSELGQDSRTKTIELDHDASSGPAIQAYLATRAQVTSVTVPQIYINQQLIGGCSDLQILHAAGKLVPLLA